MGKQSIDDDCGQTGGMLAGLLGWSVASQAAKVILQGSIAEGGASKSTAGADASGNASADASADRSGNESGNASAVASGNESADASADASPLAAKVTREVDGGVETILAPLPLVITTDLRLNEPRYASLPNIMKAKKKKVHTLELAELMAGAGADAAAAGADAGKDAGKDADKDAGKDALQDLLRPRLRVLSVTEPERRKAGVRVKDVDAFVEKLRELKAL